MSIVYFIVLLLVLYSLWNISLRIALKKLTCARTFSKRTVFEGEEAELIEVVKNDNPFVIPWLRIETKVSQYLLFGKQDNLQINHKMYHCSMFTLMPYQQIRRRHRVRFLHRGSFNLGNAFFTVGDLLGIQKFHRTQKLEAPVLVFPRILEENRIPLPLSQLMGELVQQRQLLQDPFFVRGIRLYQPGDPIRDIHWPATARTGDVQVRVHDYSAQTKLMVVLNMQLENIQWNDQIPEKDQYILEYGISVAATLCAHMLRNGFSVGFATNMPTDAEDTSTVLLPDTGAAREEELLSTMARLQVKRSEHFPPFLESLSAHSGMDFLILSYYDSDSIQEGVRALREAGNQVSVYLFQGDIS